MNWLRVRVRRFLGIDLIRGDTFSMMKRLDLLQAQVNAMDRKLDRIRGFFEHVDDIEPLTKHDTSTRNPWHF